MSHVFVLGSNIMHLECDTWMLPIDARYSVAGGWLRALPDLKDRVECACRAAFTAGAELAQARLRGRTSRY